MAQFKSRYERLGFYVDGVLKQFHAGQYSTEDKAEIEVLSAIPDVERIDEPKNVEEPAAKAPAKKPSEK